MSATAPPRADGPAAAPPRPTAPPPRRRARPQGRSGVAAPLPLRVAANAAAAVVIVASLFPVYWMVSSSLLPGRLIRSATPTWFPTTGTLDNFRRVLADGSFASALRTSLTVTLATVALALVVALLASLALARFRFRGRRGVVLAVLIVQMVPAEGLFISQYKMLEGWDLLNTVAGLTLLYLAAVLPFTIWTLRGFVTGVPVELEEAAMTDGCSRTGAFFRVTLPLLAPGLVATGVFGFIQAWNEFTLALVIMSSPEDQTLPIWLRTFSDVNRGTDWGAIMAGSTLLAIPVVVFFLLVQGKMTGGLVSGAVKG